MEKLYRKDYIGEFYVYSRDQKQGVVQEDREWVPSAIPEFAHTGHAVVIGNGPSRNELSLRYLENHRGGHRGKLSLTSYGCNALYRDMDLHYTVVTGKAIAHEIAKTEYPKNHVVYSNAEAVLKHPGNFHLIPYNQYWNAGCTATWLACFDGHKKVFLLGFDNQVQKGTNLNVYADTNGYGTQTDLVNDESWITTMYNIFDTYNDVEFVWVNPTVTPEQWRYAPNLRQITMRQFVFEADLGS